MFHPSASGRASLLFPDGEHITQPQPLSKRISFALTTGLETVDIRLCRAVLGHFSPVTHQVPLSMVFSRQECWTGLPRPPPRDLPDPGIESMSPASQADFLPLPADV